MKYIWIGILIIIEMIWFIASITDIINKAKIIKIEYLMDSLEEYTINFILLHFLALFGYSLWSFII